MARRGWRGPGHSILIEVGDGTADDGVAVAEPVEPVVADRAAGRGVERGPLRSIGAAALLALIGVALPAAMPSSRPALGSGLLEPYPTAPVVSWEVSPAIAGRGTTFVTFGPVTIDPGGGPEYSDPRHGAVLGAVQVGSTISDLFALDVHDGSVSWLAPYAGYGRFRGCADSLLSGAIVCVGQGGATGAAELFALRVSDGRELVRWDAPGWARSVAVTGDGVVLAGASSDGAELLVGRYDAWTGTRQWSRSVSLAGLGPSAGSEVAVTVPPTIDVVGARIVASIANVVAVIALNDGTLLREPTHGSASRLPGGGVLVQSPSPDRVVSPNDYVGSWDWADGEIFPADGGAGILVPGMTGVLIPALGMVGDSALILTGTDAVTAYSTTGARLWTVPAGPDFPTYWPRMMTPLGLLGSADDSLQLRDLSTGALRWLVPDPLAFIEEVLGSDGRRIVVVRGHSVQDVRDLAAIDAATGETVWSIAVAPDQLVATAGGRLILVGPTSIRGLAPTGS